MGFNGEDDRVDIDGMESRELLHERNHDETQETSKNVKTQIVFEFKS